MWLQKPHGRNLWKDTDNIVALFSLFPMGYSNNNTRTSWYLVLNDIVETYQSKLAKYIISIIQHAQSCHWAKTNKMPCHTFLYCHFLLTRWIYVGKLKKSFLFSSFRYLHISMELMLQVLHHERQAPAYFAFNTMAADDLTTQGPEPPLTNIN